MEASIAESRIKTLMESRLFAFSALLMTLSTASLVWLYGVVNGKEVRELGDLSNGSATRKARSGNAKGR